MSDRAQIWSSGGGTQSAAIAVLICMGKLPPPDFAIIVDTEREMSTTWKYMDEVAQPSLAKVGVVLHRVPKSKYATVDLMGGASGEDILIPAFTTQTGEMGKLPTFCSNEWKTRVARRWVADQGVKEADFWMGFSTDELRRVKVVSGKWQNKFPLIDLKMNRRDCESLVEKFGWPKPPRSRCWMCPNQGHAEWQDMKENQPDDFAKAVQFQHEIKAVDPDLWLSDAATPIELRDFKQPDDLLSFCKSGECFV